ncbi:DUF354 domain-containing protein [Candidatus Bathyarchaeota archaeon]|nr:DUF354 domain-containing protein [Candidatus Bathyarchaeota archaeon]
MSFRGKRIWMDMEEPKAAIQFQSLFSRFKEGGATLLVTARDFDATFKILDSLGVVYVPVGKHGGGSLLGKLESYIHRLQALLPIVLAFSPDYLVTFASTEALRISYGLGIPSIGFNDEPRSKAVCKLTLPYVDKVITPACIPVEQYLELGATREKLIRYNGIDEMGWLTHFTPDESLLELQNLERNKYVIVRSEMTTAGYLRDAMTPGDTLITDFLPRIIAACPKMTYLLIGRNEEQQHRLERQFKEEINGGIVKITDFIPNLTNTCFYSALVMSGGGTIVRESSLLGVPSIEFFPGNTAPQETFLRENGFPLWHLRDPSEIAKKGIDLLKARTNNWRERESFMARIKTFDDPTEMLFQQVKKDLST